MEAAKRSAEKTPTGRRLCITCFESVNYFYQLSYGTPITIRDKISFFVQVCGSDYPVICSDCLKWLDRVYIIVEECLEYLREYKQKHPMFDVLISNVHAHLTNMKVLALEKQNLEANIAGLTVPFDVPNLPKTTDTAVPELYGKATDLPHKVVDSSLVTSGQVESIVRSVPEQPVSRNFEPLMDDDVVKPEVTVSNLPKISEPVFNKSKKFKCKTCDFYFKKQRSLDNHLKNNH